MKLVKTTVISALILGMSLTTFNSADATTYNRDSSGKSFSKAWSSTAINTSIRTFKYGYNTAFINEDYTHTYHKNVSHDAYVKNSGSAHEKSGSAGNYAKSEIKHHSGTVYYRYTY